MTTLDRALASIRELAAMVPQGGFVLVETDDGCDPRYAAPRRLAVDVAQAARARVLYVDAAAASLAAHPYAWDAVTPWRGDATRRPLAAAELDELGCRSLKVQLQEAELRSVEAFAWLARRPGPAGIAEAARQCGAALVIFPAESERSAAARPVLRLTTAYHAWRIGVPVATVDAAGRPQLVEPLGARMPGTVSGSPPGQHATPLRAA